MPVRLAILLVALLLVPAAAAQQRPVVVIDPGHDQRANAQTEPIGPGSSTRKIKDGGGTRGVVSGLREADLDLRVSLRLRTLLERAGVRVVMTRTATAGTSIGNIARARVANRAGAALFLRVHADGSTDPSSPRNAHALPGPTRWLDGRHLLREQARCPGRPGRSPCGARLPGPRAAGAHRLHRLQLGRRAGDPRRDGLHDESDRGPAPRDGGVSAPRCYRALPGSAPLPGPLGRAVSVTV